jgi:hypothetical protein
MLAIRRDLPRLSHDASKVKDEARRAAFRTAHHDCIVGRPLVVGQHHVAVVRDSFKNVHPARSAHPIHARVRDVNAGIEKSFKHGLAIMDMERQAKTG